MKLRKDLTYWPLVGASLLWVGLTLLAPFSRSRGGELGEWIYAFFAPLCHQIPERSFHCWGEPLAACHRCMGLYIGFTVGLLLLPFWHRLRRSLLDHPRWLLAFAAPMVIDALFLPNTPVTRFGTGFLAAFPIGLFLWAAATQLINRDPTADPPSTVTVVEPGGNDYEPG